MPYAKREDEIAHGRRYRQRNKERIVAKRREYNRRNRERIAVHDRERRQVLRAQMVEAYGGRCACCGETELAFLTLDHIEGGGTKDRKGPGGTEGLYRRLKRAGWPNGYQVLCANCNMAKEAPKGCPHRRRADEA